MTGSTTRTKKQWRPAGLTFTLETFYKHWIGCYSNDIMWCVCVFVHAWEKLCKGLGQVCVSAVSDSISSLGCVYCRFPEMKVSKTPH